MKKIILALILATSLGSLANAAQSNINCITGDGKFINLTVLVDHGKAYAAQMEVISEYLYGDQEGKSSGAMMSQPTPRNGQYWYSANDSLRRYAYGLYIPNDLIFSTQTNRTLTMFFGPAGNAKSTFPVACSSEFEE